MQERIANRRLLRCGILGIVFGAERIPLPQCVGHCCPNGLSADIENHSRIVRARTICAPTVVEVTLSQLEYDRVGRIAKARPVEYRAVGGSAKRVDPTQVPLSI